MRKCGIVQQDAEAQFSSKSDGDAKEWGVLASPELPHLDRVNPKCTLVGVSGPRARPGVLCHRKVILCSVGVVVPRLVSNSIGEPPASTAGGQVDDEIELLIERSRWSGVNLIDYDF